MLSDFLPRTASVTEGPAYWFLNGLNVVMATSESTGGALPWCTTRRLRAMPTTFTTSRTRHSLYWNLCLHQGLFH